jgi:hypothetical protein
LPVLFAEGLPYFLLVVLCKNAQAAREQEKNGNYKFSVHIGFPQNFQSECNAVFQTAVGEASNRRVCF